MPSEACIVSLPKRGTKKKARPRDLWNGTRCYPKMGPWALFISAKSLACSSFNSRGTEMREKDFTENSNTNDVAIFERSYRVAYQRCTWLVDHQRSVNSLWHGLSIVSNFFYFLFRPLLRRFRWIFRKSFVLSVL